MTEQITRAEHQQLEARVDVLEDHDEILMRERAVNTAFRSGILNTIKVLGPVIVAVVAIILNRVAQG